MSRLIKNRKKWYLLIRSNVISSTIHERAHHRRFKRSSNVKEFWRIKFFIKQFTTQNVRKRSHKAHLSLRCSTSLMVFENEKQKETHYRWICFIKIKNWRYFIYNCGKFRWIIMHLKCSLKIRRIEIAK